MPPRPRSHGSGGGDGDEPEFRPLRPRGGRGRAGSIRQAEQSVGEVSRAGRAGTGAPRGTTRPAAGTQNGRGAWPPPGPSGRKPRFGEPGAAEWRYERYRQKAYQSGKSESDVLSFDDYKRLHYDKAASGQRPGRSGGPAQVAAKQHLSDNYGVQQVENVNLGGKFPDGVRPNDAGGTDYFEVGGTTQGGLPEARERAKLAQEQPALGPNDTLQFVDKHAPDEENWIKYGPGDDPHTKRRP
jgi:hypothetical protein